MVLGGASEGEGEGFVGGRRAGKGVGGRLVGRKGKGGGRETDDLVGRGGRGGEVSEEGGGGTIEGVARPIWLLTRRNVSFSSRRSSCRLIRSTLGSSFEREPGRGSFSVHWCVGVGDLGAGGGGGEGLKTRTGGGVGGDGTSLAVLKVGSPPLLYPSPKGRSTFSSRFPVHLSSFSRTRKLLPFLVLLIHRSDHRARFGERPQHLSEAV